jgi:hypothetical protein
MCNKTQIIRGRISKWVTNGSKTTVMDVIGFLCVSLGSSTVQIYDSLGRRRACPCSVAGFSSKMATVLEKCTTGEQRSVMDFRGQIDSRQRIFIKKCFLFMVGRVCRVKRFTIGSINTPKNVRKSHILPDQVRKWLRQESKRLLCFGFRRTGKAMGQVYQCWWRICREINVFFQVRVSHVLCFMSICDLFTDSPSQLSLLSNFEIKWQMLIGLLSKQQFLSLPWRIKLSGVCPSELIYSEICRAIAQAISGRSPIAAAQVPSLIKACGILVDILTLQQVSS